MVFSGFSRKFFSVFLFGSVLISSSSELHAAKRPRDGGDKSVDDSRATYSDPHCQDKILPGL